MKYLAFISLFFIVVGNNTINWDVVMRYKTIKTIEPRKPISVKAAEYDLGLVTANYRESSIYIVTKICEDKSPESSFPNRDFQSYSDYFFKKHGITVEFLSEPLLEVKSISERINCIKPR